MHDQTYTPDRFSKEVEFPRRKYVEGTSRQRVRVANGDVLDRQMVYLKPDTWDALGRIAKAQNVSGSIVIERLINLVSEHFK